jgi:hypothetical protein
MFTDKIPENTRKILEILAPSLPPATYLAGGTALSLHLNHRSSFDIDLYSRKMFNEITQIQRLKQTIPSFEVVSTEWQTIQGKSKDTDISIFFYEYPLLEPELTHKGVSIASIPDIAAMKLEAISTRGLKRDFFDLYTICTHFNYSIDHIINLANHKFSHGDQYTPHYLKSLIYFTEAETMPERAHIVDSEWQTVKQFFVNQTTKASRKLI